MRCEQTLGFMEVYLSGRALVKATSKKKKKGRVEKVGNIPVGRNYSYNNM